MQIIKHVKVCHNINLTLDTSVASTQNIHVHLHLQHATTLDILNTVRCIDPNTDILEQLNMYIHEEIEQLYDYIQQTLQGHQVVCHICGQTSHHAQVTKIKERVLSYLWFSILTIQFKKHGGNQIAIHKDAAHRVYTYTCYTPVYWLGLIQPSQCHNTGP